MTKYGQEVELKRIVQLNYQLHSPSAHNELHFIIVFSLINYYSSSPVYSLSSLLSVTNVGSQLSSIYHIHL